MAQYRKPQSRTVSATVSKSATISASGGSRADTRRPLRPPDVEAEQPIYHPDVEEPVEPEEPEAVEPETVVTVGEEQMARSAEIEAMGVEEWKRQHDERRPDEQQRAVEGVGSLEQ